MDLKEWIKTFDFNLADEMDQTTPDQLRLASSQAILVYYAKDWPSQLCNLWI